MADVCSKAMVLLLLIHWLFVLSLFGWVGVVIGPCYALLSGILHLQSSGRGRIAGFFILIVFLLALFLVFCALVSLSQGVVGWAAVCNCGMSWSSLFIFEVHYTRFFSFLFHLPNYRNHNSYILVMIYFLFATS